MDILFRVGEATAADIQQELPDEPGYSAVRALLKVLVDKGLASVEKPEGMRQLVYRPAVPVRQARKSAIKRMLSTFFSGSPSELVANLLDRSPSLHHHRERHRRLVIRRKADEPAVVVFHLLPFHSPPKLRHSRSTRDFNHTVFESPRTALFAVDDSPQALPNRGNAVCITPVRHQIL